MREQPLLGEEIAFGGQDRWKAFVAAPRPIPIAVVVGVCAGIAMLGVMEATVRNVPASSPWSATVDVVVTSLTPLFPGVVAGFLATRSGFVVGAIASVLTSIVYSMYARYLDVGSIMVRLDNPPIPDEVTFAAIAVVAGGLCGIAGAAIAREGRNAF